MEEGTQLNFDFFFLHKLFAQCSLSKKNMYNCLDLMYVVQLSRVNVAISNHPQLLFFSLLVVVLHT